MRSRHRFGDERVRDIIRDTIFVTCVTQSFEIYLFCGRGIGRADSFSGRRTITSRIDAR